jgi:hypothetical protein
MLILQWRRGMIFTLGLSVLLLFGISFAGSFAGAFTSGPIGRELGKMVGWGEFAGKVRALAEGNDLKRVVFVSRGLTASMIYELRDSNLDVRAYVADPGAPADHFEMTRPWTPADHGPVLLVFAGGEQLPAAVASRARLVEQLKTDIFIARNAGGTAFAYRID